MDRNTGTVVKDEAAAIVPLNGHATEAVWIKVWPHGHLVVGSP